MPIFPASFFMPPPPNQWFLLEDKFLRGGFRVVADQAEMNAIHASSRKSGMYVITSADNKLYRMAPDLVTFNEVSFGASFTAQEPLYLDASNILGIRASAILPTPTTAGHVLKLNSLLLPQWIDPASIGVGGGALTRVTDSHQCAQLAPGATTSFTMDMGRVIMLLELEVDAPNVVVQAFSTSGYNDTNPFTFIAEDGHLVEDGTQRLSNGTIFYGRRYSFLANLEDPNNSNIYWKVTNSATVSQTPTVNFNFLILEA